MARCRPLVVSALMALVAGASLPVAAARASTDAAAPTVVDHAEASSDGEGASVESVVSIGGDVGWSFRQIALRLAPGQGQRDLAYQFVDLGIDLRFFGLERWVGGWVRLGVAFFQALEIDGQRMPSSMRQFALSAEAGPAFTWMWGDVGLTFGAGVGFTHYLPSEGDAAQLALRGLPVLRAQQVVSVPFFVGVRVDAGDVWVTPQIGGAWAVLYRTGDAALQAGLDDGRFRAQGLDLWLRVTVDAPL